MRRWSGCGFRCYQAAVHWAPLVCPLLHALKRYTWRNNVHTAYWTLEPMRLIKYDAHRTPREAERLDCINNTWELGPYGFPQIPSSSRTLKCVIEYHYTHGAAYLRLTNPNHDRTPIPNKNRRFHPGHPAPSASTVRWRWSCPSRTVSCHSRSSISLPRCSGDRWCCWGSSTMSARLGVCRLSRRVGARGLSHASLCDPWMRVARHGSGLGGATKC